MSGRARRLVVLPSLTAFAHNDGSVGLTQKFHDGMLAYVERWPGQVEVLVEPAFAESSNLDNIRTRPEELPYGLRLLDYSDVALVRSFDRETVVLGAASHRQNYLAMACAAAGVPLAYVTEYTLRTRQQIIDANTRNPVLRARRYLWEWRQERSQRDAFSAASGLQCNGTPTFDAYRDVNHDALLYFDTRTRRSALIDDAALEHRLSTLDDKRPLRLAFSGRLEPMKGVQYLPSIARQLKERGVDFQISVCGDGPLRAELARAAKRDLAGVLELRGVLQFESELLPFVREQVDLFVCTHIQGDPSCTYLETMACGVPIIGFANEAFEGLVKQSQVGWTTPLPGRGRAVPRALATLADAIQTLDQHRHRIADASRASLAFARRHTFESTMDARIEHLQNLHIHR